MTKLAPESFTLDTMDLNVFCSYSCRFLNSSTVEISNLCFVFGFGGSNGQVRMAILTSSICLGICGWEKSFSMTTPLIKRESSKEPPTLPSTLMSSKSTSFLSSSTTAKTASTAI
ncbi:hypothetical protein WICPIJ_006019 [Wickerhamomyces pijperi]|uniref:Uncharacterized protein n=1 Tax=Wickerhamomyces pijperi TaxID=599730 RepID=A0A9P8TLE9_WICPI|nr:hypothetical protein WICPIJ_006019 [Wickerhamomyces pijperi]